MNGPRSAALGDVDGDGDLDLALGMYALPNRLLENVDGALVETPVWLSDPRSNTSSVAWGDVDGDGDLDLACGNFGDANVVYENLGGSLGIVPVWSSEQANHTEEVAWGDVDGDGDLDLVCGNQEYSTLYENLDGTLSTAPVWTSSLDYTTFSVAWADMDGDGDLDLACGNAGDPNTIYENLGGSLSTSPVWSSSLSFGTFSVAWGDVDGDGDPDLACGNVGGAPDSVYENVDGILSTLPFWTSGLRNSARSVAWADVDADGDLDLVCGNHASNDEVDTIYENVAGSLFNYPTWFSATASTTESVALGDLDRDGDLELVAAETGGAFTGVQVYDGLIGPAYRHPTGNPMHHLPNNGAYLRSVRIDRALSDQNILTVSFVAVDVESDPIHVTARYQFEGAPWSRDLDIGSEAQPPVPFDTSPSGVEGSFRWNVERLPADGRPVSLQLLVTELPSRSGLIQHVAPNVTPVGRIEPRRPLVLGAVSELSFGTITLGDSLTLSFPLVNRGNEPLVVFGIETPSTELIVTPEAPFEVPPESTTHLDVLLAPRTQLDATGELVITSNDPLQPELSVPVAAEVLPLSFSSELLREGETIPLGESVTVIVQADADVHLERGALFYRATGSTSFNARELVPSDAGFSAVVPGADVSEEGLEYYVEMENSGLFATDPAGAPGELFFQPVQAPSRLEVTIAPASGVRFVEGGHLEVTAQVEQGIEIGSAEVFYRSGGSAVYGTAPLTGEPPFLRAEIPGEAVTYRGLEWWTRIQTATATLVDPASDPSTHPRTVQISVANLAEPSLRAGGRYRLLSIPLEFEEDFTGTLASLLEFGDLDDLEWRLFRYLDGNVELRSDAGPEFRPEPGRAFWLITRRPHQVDTAPVPGLSTPTDRPYVVVVEPGWNQIGNPFAFAVAWSSVQHSAFVEPPVAFDPHLGPTGAYSNDEVLALVPFEGYFVHNASVEPESLLVPPQEVPLPTLEHLSSLGTMPVEAGTKTTASDWTLTLRASTKDAEDPSTIVGVAPTAHDGIDAGDRRKPPPMPESWIQLAIDHDDWGDRPGRYRRDLRSPGSEGYRWDLVLRTSEVGEEVTLSGWNEVTLPAGLELRLLDREHDVTLDIDGQSDSYPLLSYGRERDYRLTLLAGSPEYVADETGALVTVPKEATLEQNTPNPFNPVTSIRFGLPAAGRVTLAIYNVRGELVDQLLDGESLPAGFHTRLWRGRDRGGRRVANGVYIYRLQTEGETLHRKMLLVQ